MSDARSAEDREFMDDQGKDQSSGAVAPDPRGHMHRVKRLMPHDDARAFLRMQKVAHAGTVDPAGHFQRNVESHPRVCVEVADMGPVHRGHLFACNSALDRIVLYEQHIDVMIGTHSEGLYH